MRIKNTAFVYNVTVQGSSNCDWGTDIGQSKKHTFTLDGFPEFVNAMVYYKIEDPEKIQVILGKGNRTPKPFSAYTDNQLVLASCLQPPLRLSMISKTVFPSKRKESSA